MEMNSSNKKYRCIRCHAEYQYGADVCQKCGARIPDQITEVVPWIIQPCDPHELPVGFKLGNRFQVIERLGMGGMGIVYKAYDIELDEIVALKILRPELDVDGSIVELFKQEIKIARRIKHPNVCSIYDFLIFDEYRLISMEYIDGIELSMLIRDKMVEEEFVPIISGIALALKAAHQLKIIHRDLKPSNIMIDAQLNPIVMDFGIASRVDLPNRAPNTKFFGTPSYMAPEQALGQTLDHRSDIYSLGIIMYEITTGTLPFTGTSPMDIAVKHIYKFAKSPRLINAKINKEIERMILKCIEKYPEKRYQSIDEFLADLQIIANIYLPVEAKRKPLILVVDDDDGIRSLVVNSLVSHNFNVISAADGVEAIDAALKQNPDLILMDLMMPGIDGYRAVELLAQNPRTKNIPIFLITSLKAKDYRAYSKAIGVKEFIIKPFKIEELISKVKAFIAASQENKPPPNH